MDIKPIRLDVLATLVEAYERKPLPDGFARPGRSHQIPDGAIGPQDDGKGTPRRSWNHKITPNSCSSSSRKSTTMPI